MSRRTVIIGAGVIGAALAHQLVLQGRQVTLLDRAEPGRGASFGNLASIAVSRFMPAARPSTLRKIPGWLLNSESPVCVRPLYIPRLMPWFCRFLLAARASSTRRLEKAGAALCGRALKDTQALLRAIGAEDQISKTGCLSLYKDEAEFNAERDYIEKLQPFGFDYEILSRDALREKEPEIGPGIGKAILFPDNRSIRDPHGLVTRLAARFAALGGEIIRGEVIAFTHSQHISAVHLKDGRELPADEMVLCAGAFTGQLAKLLGEPIPLEAERGYHTQINAPGIALNHAIIWPARAFMIAPVAGGLRVGGTGEMAGLNAPPDWRRAKITVRHAREALPNLKVTDATEWMGHRPALPDTVPVLSASAKIKGVFYATGHGHLGLTQAATTARLMGQLILGKRRTLICTPIASTVFNGAHKCA